MCDCDWLIDIVGNDAYDRQFVYKYARYEGTNDVVLVTEEKFKSHGNIKNQIKTRRSRLENTLTNKYHNFHSFI
jgi:hypothetical protein